MKIQVNGRMILMLDFLENMQNPPDFMRKINLYGKNIFTFHKNNVKLYIIQ